MSNNPAGWFKKSFISGMAILLWIGLAACEAGPRVKMAPGYDATSTPLSAQADVMGTPKPAKVPPTPTPEPLILDNNRYSLPSKALVFQLPLGWTLTSESSNNARFDAPDKSAWMEAAVESCGYALPAEDFQIYTENLRQSLYAHADSQNLLDRQIDTGQAAYVTCFLKEGVFWFAYDVFIQKEKAIYSFSFQTSQLLWEAYLPGFRSVAASAETNTGYVGADMIYSFMRPYTSPNNQFTLTIPMSWTFTLGQNKLKNALLDTAVSPDGKAGVSIVAYNARDELKNKDVGQVSIPIIKQLEGQELRVRSTDLLNDGRIRVNWQIDDKGIQGYSFFWQDQSIVYIFTLKYPDQYAGTYKEVMDNIGDSFRFPGES